MLILLLVQNAVSRCTTGPTRGVRFIRKGVKVTIEMMLESGNCDRLVGRIPEAVLEMNR